MPAGPFTDGKEVLLVIAPAAFRAFDVKDYEAKLQPGLRSGSRGMMGTNPDAIEAWAFDPKTLAVAKTITVRDAGTSIDRLNELEFVDDEIWANVWTTDRIVRIAPSTGDVTGWIALDSLWPRNQRRPSQSRRWRSCSPRCARTKPRRQCCGTVRSASRRAMSGH